MTRALRRSLWLALTIAVSMSLAHADVRPDKVVTVEGSAPCRVGGEASARPIAVADALRRAVEEALGVQVEAETDTSNYSLARDAVRTTADGFVRTYAIVDEGLRDGLYRVTIRAAVAPGDPALALKSICARLKESVSPTFRVTSSDDLSGVLLRSELALLGLRVTDLRTPAKRPQAEVEITGRIEVQPVARPASGFFASRASADLGVKDGRSIVLPSVGVTLPRPVVAMSQAEADSRAARAVAKLWARRNIPIIAAALLSPKDHPYQAERPTASEPREDSTKPEPRRSLDAADGVVGELASKLADAMDGNSAYGTHPTLAVVRFELSGDLKPVVADDLCEDLTAALVKTGAFDVVERTQIAAALRELETQNSGLVGETARSIGKLSGARLLIVGSVSDREDRVVINARIVDSETGRICAAESVAVEKENAPLVLHAGPGR